MSVLQLGSLHRLERTLTDVLALRLCQARLVMDMGLVCNVASMHRMRGESHRNFLIVEMLLQESRAFHALGRSFGLVHCTPKIEVNVLRSALGHRWMQHTVFCDDMDLIERVSDVLFIAVTCPCVLLNVLQQSLSIPPSQKPAIGNECFNVLVTRVHTEGLAALDSACARLESNVNRQEWGERASLR